MTDTTPTEEPIEENLLNEEANKALSIAPNDPTEEKEEESPFVDESSGFRKEALTQLQVPDELDLLFTPVSHTNTWAWVTLSLLALCFVMWFIFGSIPISIEGSGILLKDTQNKWVVYAYLPVEIGKQIRLDQKVEIEPSTVRASEYGGILGSIIGVSSYPVSEEFIAKTLQNEAIVTYLTQKKTAVLQVVVNPLLDPKTPTGLKWTSQFGPSITLTPGTVCVIKGIVGHVRPIYYFFPLSRFQHLSELPKTTL